MTTTDTPNVTVQLADLRAKVAFLTDQLGIRTSQRDQAVEARDTNLRIYLDGTAQASDTISRLCSELDDLRPHLTVLVDRQAQWGDTEAAISFVSNWLEGYKP